MLLPKREMQPIWRKRACRGYGKRDCRYMHKVPCPIIIPYTLPAYLYLASIPYLLYLIRKEHIHTYRSLLSAKQKQKLSLTRITLPQSCQHVLCTRCHSSRRNLMDRGWLEWVCVFLRWTFLWKMGRKGWRYWTWGGWLNWKERKSL
jgi:hypothetical protein